MQFEIPPTAETVSKGEKNPPHWQCVEIISDAPGLPGGDSRSWLHKAGSTSKEASGLPAGFSRLLLLLQSVLQQRA